MGGVRGWVCRALQLWVGPTQAAGAPDLQGWLEAISGCQLLRAYAHLLPQNGVPGGGGGVGGAFLATGGGGRTLAPALVMGASAELSHGSITLEPQPTGRVS